MTNALLNRMGVQPSTNKSGGAVAYGAVVIAGSSSPKSFTTTTTEGFKNSMIGVVVEPAGIPNNGTGLVAWGLWAPRINLDASAALYDFIKTDGVAGQGTPHAAPMQAGDFAIALETGTNPTALLLGAPFQGGGASGSGSFPSSPIAGAQFYRTDRNLEYYFDGTRWLTTSLYIASPTPGDAGAPPYSTSPGTHGYLPVDPTYGMYLVAIEGTTGVFGTNDGSNYWTIALDRRNAGNTNTNIASYTTAADTASNWVSHSQAINAVLDASAKILIFTHTKTGAPANLYISSRLLYRLIG